MPKRTIAWLWRPGESKERRGTLSLEGGTATFRSDDGEQVRFGDVERARRQRGTPVLEIRYLREGKRRAAFLFFARPPERPDPEPVPSLFGVIGIRGMRRVGDMGRIRAANRRLKPLIEEWEEALRPRR
ncbi:MAG TPA: hypothetical protein VF097_11455 [Actinomycetota bacterium]